MLDGLDNRVMLRLPNGLHLRRLRKLGTRKQEGARRREWQRDDAIQRGSQHFISSQPNHFGMKRFVQIQVTRKLVDIHRGFRNCIHFGLTSLPPAPPQTGLVALFAPLGKVWYDALQAKVTKRLSRGLDFSYAFTFQKELTMGAEADTTGGGAVNDIFDRGKQKQISSLSRPFTSVLALNYRLPKWGPNRIVSQALRDWTVGTVIQDASGLPILAPQAQNTTNINSYLFRGGVGTYANRVAGQPLYLKDLNCHCVDPRKDLILNPAAWTNPADGHFGTSAPYFSDYRFQRRPQENFAISRTFRLKADSPMALNVRMEFTNILNRTEMPDPVATNFAATRTTNAQTGALTGGFGFINPASISRSPVQPRQGTLVARFTF